MIKNSKRSQAWGIDITVALVIFIAGLVGIYLYSINLSAEAQETLNLLSYDGNLIASTLLQEGTPSDWHLSLTPGEVIIPGLITDGKINSNKLSNFSNLIQTSPSLIQAKLNTQYNFCITIANLNEICTCYDTNCFPPQSAPNNLVKIERYVAYENIPSSMELIIWN